MWRQHLLPIHIHRKYEHALSHIKEYIVQESLYCKCTNVGQNVFWTRNVSTRPEKKGKKGKHKKNSLTKLNTHQEKIDLICYREFLNTIVIYVLHFTIIERYPKLFSSLKGTSCLGPDELVCEQHLKPFVMKCIWLERCFQSRI